MTTPYTHLNIFPKPEPLGKVLEDEDFNQALNAELRIAYAGKDMFELLKRVQALPKSYTLADTQLLYDIDTLIKEVQAT